ncbi:Ig-like domain-containing protein [Pedococcus dokdonensis]|uniref:Ig-like domain-containing protein n=1 Tax=Pedococcus dokdonensis TaxID=443156 RepID=A0A1H0RW35_9MICO|nr:NBR1-Ig-like domain-containing protein [Pedococcus dokdonensis]SDP33791.1 Ig-like domain-containing protein [Pedococcus dokdonensis]
MGDRTTTMRAQAIEGFAATLADLRDAAGRPSFRVMAGRSKAISHTTLHEAVHGNRLPSWATTAEFVKACGADPGLYREQWARASCAVAAVTHGAVKPAETAVDGPEHDSSEAVPTTSRPEPTARWWRRDRRVLLGAAATVFAVASGLGVTWSAHGQADPPARPARGPVAADCPVHQQNPPAAAPTHRGDRATFVSDVTLGDCSHVPAGQVVTKVWRLKNAGSVPWVGYTLRRIDLPQGRDQCQTIPDVTVSDTAPGAQVDVAVGVTLPSRPTFCLVRFKLVDAAGQVAFPGSRPVTLQVIVDPRRSPEAQVVRSGS